MAVKREMTIVIAADGTVELTTHGFKGAECEEETRPFEKLGVVKSKTRTQESYEKARAGTKVTTKAK